MIASTDLDLTLTLSCGEMIASTDLDRMSGGPVYDRAFLTPAALGDPIGRRVTLLGDAAHPMSPFKGTG
jgi:salicylate hydroxylase